MTLFRRLTVHHWRLWLGVLAGGVGFLLAPGHWSAVGRMLVGWNVGAMLFAILLYPWMSGLDSRQMQAHYREDDPTAPVMLLLVTIAALLSLVAIVALLGAVKHATGADEAGHIALAASTVIVSWVMVAMMFALHYADLYYSVPLEQAPLDFPGDAQPVFADFLYFSFTIAAACQTSDVATKHPAMRKVVTIHTIVSFFFNVSVLGFAINVTAGLIGGG